MESKLVPTFLPEISGEEVPMYTVATGDDLRRLYVARAYAAQVNDWVAEGTNPVCITPEERQILIEQWMADAYILYPEEGDYRVRLLDDNGVRLPIGDFVEHIVEQDQVATSPCPEPEVPNCPTQVIVIQICNSNAAIDDNFDIYLNNILIGAVDLSTNAQVGSLFIADTDTNLVLTSSDFTCPINQMVKYNFNPSALHTSNVLEMRNTQNNGLGNAGSIGIRSYTQAGLNLSNPCVIADLQYAGSSGTSFTFNFNYTECCGQNT